MSEDEARVEQAGERWDVHVRIPAGGLNTILSALHDCLVANDITMVRLTIDDKTYAMEATGADGREWSDRSAPRT